jgi:ribonuclease E
MLIDARHREETRVAVIKGNRIEEFDFESAEHKQLKGNIYLAKVTRVEPSLQAAFVEYGGNRHGFLAFSEIHPDYYQIPKEDREALLREEAEHAAAEAAMRAEEDLDELEGEVEDIQPPEPLDDDGNSDQEDTAHDGDEERDDDRDDGENGDDGPDDSARGRGNNERGGRGRGRNRRRGGRDRFDDSESDDRRFSLRRRYKIQDVIKRRQVMLVQVVKEERGNKGAALTTYLSLAGRYCVLMPNSSHGGGISRKISSSTDRKRLKSVIDELGLPTTMGCIVRTAGLERTKTEIKRDFDYLARLWDEIRDKTLHSEAPTLIHSDSDLIKRAIRDIYNSDIAEVLVEGDDGYRAAKDFMKLLMPSHARRVKQYADPVPLFQRYGVEDQLGAMYQPVVPLKSGGYLVINPTEALVSIDINSGRSTREHNIEGTATSTNLEAAYEIARQLRLRDMAGLVVIDFIDMDMGSNVRKVERAMKDALKHDRARIQVGRISGFGLMEMSRQRLRTGVLEASTRVCPHCEGTGLVRTASSAGLSALRLLEEEAARGKGSQLILRASQEASFYVLNKKRAELSEIEGRYGVAIEVLSDGETEGARMTVEVSGPPPANVPKFLPIVDDEEDDSDIPDFDDGEVDDDEAPRRDGRGEPRSFDRERGRGEERDGPRRGRRRRRRGGRRDGAEGSSEARDEGRHETRADADAETVDSGDADREATAERSAAPAGDTEAEGARRRRRGRRGGRNRSRGEGGNNTGPGSEAETATAGHDDGDDDQASLIADAAGSNADDAGAPLEPEAPKRRGRKPKAAEAAEPVADVAVEPAPEDAPAKPKRRSRKAAAEVAAAPAAAESVAVEVPEGEAATAKPKRSRTKRPATDMAEPEMDETTDREPVAVNGDEAAPQGEARPRRTGWWQRTFGN